jgi:murein DD-endopeptidase MepM/ murein hydrolase activator NlpD
MNLAILFYALVGSPFGFSAGYVGFHTGTDFPWGPWKPIPMFATGRVAAKGYNTIHGHWVSVIVGDTYFHFCHMAAASVLEVGAQVNVGDIVGYVGDTGQAQGFHLHLAASNHPTPGNGTRRDPLPLVRAWLTTSAGGSGHPIPETPELEEEETMNNRPLYWVRKTKGPIENSLFLLVQAVGDRLVGLELDGRTPAGRSQVQDIRNQYAQYFSLSVFGSPSQAGRGVPFAEVSLLEPIYDSIKLACDKIVSPAYPPLK